MRFDDAPGLFTHGRGRFADIRGVHLRSGDWRTTELRRITKSRDVRTMTTGSDSEKRALLDQTLRGVVRLDSLGPPLLAASSPAHEEVDA